MRNFLNLLLQIFRAGRGRPIAAVFLAGFMLLQVHQECAPFKGMRLALFDAYQTYLPRDRISAPATIVAIDETSLNRYGQWPWPRTRLADLIERIAAFRPAAIGLDIIMPEADRASPAQIAASLPQIGSSLRRRLASLPDNDRILADTLCAHRVVLGVAGFDHRTPSTAATLKSAAFTATGADVASMVRRFPAVLKSIPGLEAAASGQALLSADLEKGVVRRLPLVAAVNETLVPSLSIELLRAASGVDAYEVGADSGGMTHVTLGDIRIPTQTNGEVWVDFAPFSPERYVSAADVFTGRVNPELLRQKLVLVGVTGIGLLDYQTTARGERVPGIEVHAQFLENLFDQRFLRRPSWMPLLEAALLIVCGALLLFAVPEMQPRLSAVTAGGIAVLLLAAGVVLYRTHGLLFDAASLFVGINTVFASLLGSTFIETDRQRRIAQHALQIEREAAARIAGELEAARRIQMGSLPHAAAAFPGEKRFELDAMLEPAREVGGDLYDFYMPDRRRLFFIVGDVSGKGLPASLFMIMTKALTKTIVLNEKPDVGMILNRVNIELARENPEMIFVTAFAAMLDAESGVMEYCIAGHDAPWHVAGNGTVKRLAGEGNLPLCVLETVSYPVQSIQLAAGDTVCVVTDGITEAMNGSGELYGRVRLTRLLEGNAASLSVAGLVGLLHDDVRSFVGSAEQSDDLTLLVVRWYGAPTP